MEYVAAVCGLMRLLSVTDKCKKQRKCQGWAQLQRAFLPSCEISNAKLYLLGVTAHNHQVIHNCLKLREYNIRHHKASGFVCSHPVDYQR